jgi:3-deoxy-D-manno-octulosonic-acid transferase
MLYNLAIVIYDFIVHLAAPFSRKPRKMMKGHWVVYELLRQQVEKGEQYIWFHAASLGEFEQGRPLIEMIRAKYPNYKILLTFFSDNDETLKNQLITLSTKYYPTLSADKETEMIHKIESMQAQGDSIGGILESVVINMPAGIGEPFFNSIESKLSQLIYSIPALKAFLHL